MTVPEPSSVKYFVGQVPRAFDESHLKPIFEEYGPIYQLNVLRDKSNCTSKGCCFVTFFKAEHGQNAQKAMHNKVTLQGMNHPVQMKPADTEKRNVDERKLFVGMLSKTQSEEDITLLFSPYGKIDECTILRDAGGSSRGCAFVTFATKESAANAVRQMHESACMEGCSSPIKVRLADTQREKENKRQVRLQQEQLAVSPLSTALGASLYPTAPQGGATAAALGAGLCPPQYVQLLQGGLQGDVRQAVASVGLPTIDPNVQAAYAGLGLAVTPALGGATGALPSVYSNTAAPTPTIPPLQVNTGYATAGLNAYSPLSLPTIPPGYAAIPNFVPMAGGMQLQLATPALTTPTQGLGSAGSGSTGTSPSPLAQALPGVQQAPPTAIGAAQQGLPVNSMQDATLTQAFSGLQQYAGLSQGYAPAVPNLSSGLQPEQNQQSVVPGVEQAPATYALVANLHQYVASQTVALGNSTGAPSQPAAVAAAAQMRTQESPAGKQTEGPDGANLFIYHLPQEFTDDNLAQTFAAYGRVVSAKVFVDQNTQLSKCFGFVSYDNPSSAQTAITAMNGFQIGMKRLKVQLKKPRMNKRPY